MYKLIKNIITNQLKFFVYYFLTVFALIIWSYVEGVGDIKGYILLDSGSKINSLEFKSGYFSSLNYGIYYLIFLPLFLRAVFNTYLVAERLSNLPEQDGTEQNEMVNEAIRNYNSYIIKFSKAKISIAIFILFLLFFSYQGLVVEKNDYKSLSLGWVQGLALKKQVSLGRDTFTIPRKFYFRDNMDLTFNLRSFDSIKVANLSFASKRAPGKIEFICFVACAKLFFSIFTAIVFFFNLNMIAGLFKFFSEKNKKILFQSKQYVSTLDELISNISLAGFFLTIFLFFRYVTNSQKGTFKPFNWHNIMAADQYIFLLGMLFIPISSIALFTYVYMSNQTVDLKKLSWKNLISFYFPTIAFFITFFIYLICFDPFMESQLEFFRGILQFINKIFLG